MKKVNAINKKVTPQPIDYVVDFKSQINNDYLENISKPLNDITYYQVQNRIMSRKLYATRRK